MIEPTVIFATALLLVLWWLWAIEYRRYRVLVLKSSLFEARDALFAAAEQGKLSFDDPAYGMSRILLNGMLRQAEALSVTRTWWSDAGIEQRFNAQYARAQTQLTESGRDAVRGVINRAHIAIVSHVLHISLLFGLPLHLLKAWYRITAPRARSRNMLETIVFSGSTRGPVHETLGTLDASAHLVGDLTPGRL